MNILSLNRNEKGILAISVLLVALLGVLVLAGVLSRNYLFFILTLASVYSLLSLGLNVQWGYTGLINFSVVAFFGIGAYASALLTGATSPLGIAVSPIIGALVGIVVAGIISFLIAVPTLRLQKDYLSIVTLGLAEIFRIVVLNAQEWTNGPQGVVGIPSFHVGWLFFGDLAERFGRSTVDFSIFLVITIICYFFLRHVQISPYGRVLKTIRTNEDLAKALGKNSYSFKIQMFVLGSILMALAGSMFVHFNRFIGPTELAPVTTFYVWIAVILGGTGSNRGSIIGGFILVLILEGTRFIGEVGSIPVEGASIRIFFIGILIISIMRLRPDGILPPTTELIKIDSTKKD
jgi:branched-chain amino acid transport system permease protein